MVVLKILISLYLLTFNDCLKTSYPFSCRNPKLNFTKLIESSFRKNEILKGGNPPEWYIKNKNRRIIYVKRIYIF
jgi:hypothetical protein